MSLSLRLNAPGPKRILALDGGGIRGALTLGYLVRIEALLRERHGRPDLKLSDYFDLIGGTSTGAIIGAGLSIGMSAEALMQIYLEFGAEIFAEKQSLGLLRGRFNAAPLMRKLEKYFGDITLGSDEIKTGLCVVTKRADTNSTWPLINHPEGAFYRHNKHMLLRDVVRASTAAPTYFIPEELSFEGTGGAQHGLFIDGGVSLHNNPALLLFLIATLKGFPFHWPQGEDNLFLVSIGTGFWQQSKEMRGAFSDAVWEWGRVVPGMLTNDASWLNQLILQYMSRSPTAHVIDLEVGDLRNDMLGDRPLLSYVRYNVELDVEPLIQLGFGRLVHRLGDLRDMSDASNREDLNRIGVEAAMRQVQPAHFPCAFDLQQAPMPQ
jgi:Patatin-like phospholipase